MKIQLDTKALESLFPEGSEARIELQNAVIANFAKKMQEKHCCQKNIKLFIWTKLRNFVN